MAVNTSFIAPPSVVFFNLLRNIWLPPAGPLFCHSTYNIGIGITTNIVERPSRNTGGGPTRAGLGFGLTRYQSINQRSSQATHGQGEATSQHHHSGKQSLRHLVTQAWGSCDHYRMGPTMVADVTCCGGPGDAQAGPGYNPCTLGSAHSACVLVCSLYINRHKGAAGRRLRRP